MSFLHCQHDTNGFQDPKIGLRRGREAFAGGRYAEAAEQLEAYCVSQPDDAAAACDLGSALIAGGRAKEALAALAGALRADPGLVPAHINLGVALLKLERPHEALVQLEEAAALAPDDPVACFNRGVALRTVGRHGEAVECLSRAEALRPAHPETALEQGHALREAGRTDEAAGAYRRALAYRPGWPEAAHELGRMLHAGRRYDEAADALRTALALAPGDAGLWNELGSALHGAARHAEAVDAFGRALAAQPGLTAAYCNMALSLSSLGRPEEGIAACRRAIALEAGGTVPRANLGYILLSLGRYREGWEEYEYRFAVGKRSWFRPEAGGEPWLGEDLAGRSILVLGEQGYGDHIHFARYLPLLAAAGARVTLLAPGRLHRLLRTLPGDVALVEAVPAGARFDFQWPLMSLPLRFEQRGDGLPATVPYLRAEPERVAQWRERIGPAGFRVGIAWQGNKEGAVDIGRSFPLERMRPLAGVPGVRLISLQVGEAAGQVAGLLPGMAVEVLDGLDGGGDDAFLDTAAVMDALDLVVTSDTAVAHLAGALGRPVWVALSSTPEWRWLREREDSPWYPTARLFRQRSPGDWNGVFADMAAGLAALVPNTEAGQNQPRAALPVPRIPVPFGDLCDRVCILEIKSERFSGAALVNVLAELDGLRAAVAVLGPLPPELAGLRQRLRETNERLWQLEDEIREFEAAGRFDSAFVAAARAIYFVNDERGRIKRDINLASGSPLMEEKHYQSY